MNKTMESVGMLLTLDNPVFGCFVYWASILIVKMLLMSILTALQRFRYKVFISPEDEAFAKGNAEVQENDPHVDRVRRAHLNDIENILPFLTMGLLFVCLNPNATLAMVLFRIQGAARIIHTLVYAFGPVPQPSRAIAFFVAYFDTLFMGGYAIVRTIQYI